MLILSKTYKQRPSEILGIKDDYTAFCLDEACAYIKMRIEKGDEPSYAVKANSFSSFYDNLRREGVV